jgi:dethiobiotin synthetase
LPDRLVVALGTGTGVGKTWVGAQVLRRLRAAGVAVAARKPTQSFAPGEGPTDAEVLAEATGERPEDVCPPHRWYEMAMAPPLAATRLGRPAFGVADLVAELRWPPEVEVGWVETAGGPHSPLTADGDSLALAVAVGAHRAVLVADAGLGAINAVRLSAAALAGLECPVVVVLTRFDGGALHRSNLQFLRDDGLDVVTGVEEVVGRVG